MPYASYRQRRGSGVGQFACCGHGDLDGSSIRGSRDADVGSRFAITELDGVRLYELDEV